MFSSAECADMTEERGAVGATCRVCCDTDACRTLVFRARCLRAPVAVEPRAAPRNPTHNYHYYYYYYSPARAVRRIRSLQSPESLLSCRRSPVALSLNQSRHLLHRQYRMPFYYLIQNSWYVHNTNSNSWYQEFISWYHKFNSWYHELNSWLCTYHEFWIK